MSAHDTAAKLAFFDALSCDRAVIPLDCRVAWRLLHYVNRDTGYAWPSPDLIGREIGCDERTVRRSIKRLVEGGWFRIHASTGGGRGRTNRYSPCLERGAALSTSGEERGAALSTFEEERGAPVSEKGGSRVQKGGQPCPPNPLPESLTKTLDRTRADRGASDTGQGGAVIIPLRPASGACGHAQVARQRNRAGAPSPRVYCGDGDQWKARIRNFLKSGLWIADMWGPDPSHPGCQAPAGLIGQCQREEMEAKARGV